MKHLLSVAVLSLLATTAFAQGGGKQKSTQAGTDLKAHIEMHEKMAKAHDQAADCLKDGKPIEECRAEFKKACPGDGQGCGMMGMGHGARKGKKAQ